MSQTINGIVYYQTNEACKLAGISRATYFRWLKEGTIEDVKHKDRRGWRLFTEQDIDRLKEEAQKVISNESAEHQLKLRLK
jgi:excisionase family DNA binding protein